MTQKSKKPPKIAQWLLEYIVDEYAGYTALGDFEEQFHANCAEKGTDHCDNSLYVSVVCHNSVIYQKLNYMELRNDKELSLIQL